MAIAKRIHVLGTGVAIVRKYYNTAFVLEDESSYFLVDGMGGIDILRRFDEMKLDWQKLHHAFLSHTHTDHSLGMVYVLRYVAFLMRLNQYDGDFHLYTHKVAYNKIRKVCELILDPHETRYFDDRIIFHVVEDREEKLIWNLRFHFFDIQSTKEAQFGFKAEAPDGSNLVFCGDEPICESVEEIARNADWLCAEAYCLYEEREIETPYRYHHSTVKDEAELAEKLQVKHLILWHTIDRGYPNRKKLYTKEASAYYSGDVIVPDDGEIIDLKQKIIRRTEHEDRDWLRS